MIRTMLILVLLACSMTVSPTALAVPTCANPLALNGIADGGADALGVGDTQYWSVGFDSNVIVQVINTVPVFVEAYADAGCASPIPCTDVGGLGLTWVCTPLFVGQKLSVTGMAFNWSQYVIASLV